MKVLKYLKHIYEIKKFDQLCPKLDCNFCYYQKYDTCTLKKKYNITEVVENDIRRSN